MNPVEVAPAYEMAAAAARRTSTKTMRTRAESTVEADRRCDGAVEFHLRC